MVDGRLKTTTINYGAACNATTPSGFVNAKNQVTSVEYDCATGAMSRFTDANQQSSIYTYNDLLDRLTAVAFPDGGQTSYKYCDLGSSTPCGALPSNSVQATTLQNSCVSGATTNSLVSLALYDGLGRSNEARQIEAATTITTKAFFDGLGRAQSVSLPYRGADTNAVFRTTVYDGAGRVTSVTEPGNAVTSIAYLGAATTTTDASGKAKRQTTDAAGRLVHVVEDPSGANLLTSYRYDSLNNLVKVCQGAIMDSAGVCPAGASVRSFDYDGLAWLRKAANRESGDINYTYDNAGNLATRVDARGITTTMGYDDLNRLLSKTYSDTTPAVTYQWDLVFLGRLESVSNANSISKFLAYDAMGRPTASEQRISLSEAYQFAYTYNKAGGLETETYPSQRVVKQCYDEAGRVKTVSARVSAGATETVIASVESATNPQNPSEAWPGYTALGGMLRLRLGNGKVEQRCYNSRGQQTELRLGGVYTTNCGLDGGDLFRTVVGYGATANLNNGNVMSQQVEARKDDNLTFLTLVQSYNYDGLNRLTGVGETGGTAWSQTFAYDRNGNQAVTATFPMTGMAVNQLDRYDLGTNRLVKYNDGTALPTGVYDAAGNMTNHRDLGAVGYDAENRMTQVTSGANSSYGYDGEGRRVRRVSGGVGWTYVYDALGRLAAEVGGTAGSGISYLTADQLGSTRVVTNGSGGRTMCSDYLPFGEQMTTGSPGSSRGGVGCYGMGGTVAQRFTGKERDAETGLDYFGARYMSAAQGRFTSPDAPFADQHTIDPQSWNLYAYVRNNPLKNTDPNGRDCFQGVVSCANYVLGGVGAVTNAFSSGIINLPNRLADGLVAPFNGGQRVFGDLVPDAFTATNTDQRQGMEAANAVMLVSPLVELGAARAVSATAATLSKSAPAVAEASSLTAAEIQAGLKNAPLKTGQEAISAPAVNRYMDKIRGGQTAPPIKVDGNVIVDGNHRYAAGVLTGKPPATTPGTASPSQVRNARPFGQMKVDPKDWGNH